MPKVNRTPLLSWARFEAKWKDCRLCSLCEGRTNIVLAKGIVPRDINDIPCDVVLIGEAPGDSEDIIGRPFVGPAGHLLDDIIKRSIVMSRRQDIVRIAYANLVCCIPREQKQTDDHAPPHEAIMACRNRLDEFVKLCRPKLIVCVGALASKYLDVCVSHREAKRVDIVHPAAILRGNVAMKGQSKDRAIITLANALEDL